MFFQTSVIWCQVKSFRELFLDPVLTLSLIDLGSKFLMKSEHYCIRCWAATSYLPLEGSRDCPHLMEAPAAQL